MGIGKSLQALGRFPFLAYFSNPTLMVVVVNIIDGAPSDPDDPVKTTLLVVPSHLCKHW
jgi:hypothetical protein